MNNAKKIIKEQGLKKPDKKVQKEQAKSRKNLILIIIGAIIILGGVFVVCYTQLRPRAILTVDGPGKDGNTTNTVYYTDAMYDIYQMESTYNAYGMDWDSNNGSGTLSTTVKDQIMDTLKEREVLYMQALKDGTTLDDSELKELDTEVSDAMKALKENSKDVKGLSESYVRASLEKKKLADKQKQKIIDGFDIDDAKLTAEVSKTDYRQYTIQYYMISKEAEGSSDSDAASGSAVKLKDEATLKKAKSDMEALLKKAKTADDFTKLITDSDNDMKDDETGIAYDTEDLLETNTDFADEKTRALIKKMSNDQISDVIETDTMYYIFKMVNNDDPEAYDNEVKNKIENEENSQYSTYYNGTLKKQYTFKIEEYWKNRVTVGGITVDD
ncbi:MAG: peptidylprolyl isomerase [Eubacterium sp.]|nr:peptidylprolyl isomerase [Eubacterium sp.]